MQKALRSLETGLTGLDEIEIEGLGKGDDANILRAAIGVPTPDRLLKVAQALRLGMSVAEAHEVTKIDPWFLQRLADIIALEDKVKQHGLPADAGNFRRLKAAGFSDARLAALARTEEATVSAARENLGVRPVYKRIDTCAAEFASPTAYMYSTYETPFGDAPEDEALPSDKRKIVILGGGPNRIGQGIEFDYCCCHACFALSDAGFETIMINCNPETVSTDYDTSDRLYFEPLTAEDVLAILAKEKENGELVGVIVQFGGQTPLKLAHALEASGAPILGTSVDSIDLAEDRDRFKRLLDKLGLKQPKNGIAYSVEQSRLVAADLGLPLVVRPSYVLGGRAMAIIRDERDFDDYLLGVLPSLVPADVKARYPNDKTGQINTVLGKNPLLFDRYLSDAIEIDVDALCDGKTVFVLRRDGAHRGGRHPLRGQRLLAARPLALRGDDRQARGADDQAGAGARRRRLDERAIRAEGWADLRAGGQPARLAHGALRGQGDRQADRQDRQPHHGRRTARLLRPDQDAARPCRRQGGGVPVRALSPASIRCSVRKCARPAEVMGLARDFPLAFAKSQLGAGAGLPKSGTVFVSLRESDKPGVVGPLRELAALGFRIVATGGTQKYLAANGVAATRINKVSEGRPHAADMMRNGGAQLVFNTTEGATLAQRLQAAAPGGPLAKNALLHHSLRRHRRRRGGKSLREGRS